MIILLGPKLALSVCVPLKFFYSLRPTATVMIFMQSYFGYKFS